jgi:two-component sensor histidine kinase
MVQRPRPPRLVYSLAVWTGIGLFFVAQSSVYRVMVHQPLLQPSDAALPLATCWLWGALTPVIWRLGGRFDFEGHPLLDLLVHACALAAILLGEGAFDWRLLLPALGMPARPYWRIILDASWVDLSAYFCIMAMERMQRFHFRALEQATRAGRLEVDLRQAKLQALEAQLRPHFLFNALNTISSLVRGGQHQAAVSAVAALGDVLRGSLHQTAAEVSLRDELTLAQRYLDLERARFGEAVSFTVEADAISREALVPALLLQPLVENALKHGRGQDGRAHIAIRASSSGRLLRVEVEDQGAGPSPGAADGIGMSNTRARLQQLYGDRGRLNLMAARGGGALAVVELPLKEARHA